VSRLLPCEEAASRLGRSPQYIRKNLCRHKAGLPAAPEASLGWLKRGGRLFLFEDELEAFLASLRSSDCTGSRVPADGIDNASGPERTRADLRIVPGEQA